MLLRALKAAFSLAIIASHLVNADDLPVYTDGNLAAGWENWSWSSTIDFAATDLFVGTSSISVVSDAWAAFSVKLEGSFPTYAGLKFDIAVYSVISLKVELALIFGTGRATRCIYSDSIFY